MANAKRRTTYSPTMSAFLNTLYGNLDERPYEPFSPNYDSQGMTAMEAEARLDDAVAMGKNALAQEKPFNESTDNFIAKTSRVFEDLWYEFAGGILKFADSLGDLFFNAVDAAGGGVEWAQGSRDYDWMSPVLRASSFLTPTDVISSYEAATKGGSQEWSWDNFWKTFSWEGSQAYISNAKNQSPLENNELGTFARGTASTIGFMVPSIIAAAVTGGATSSATAAEIASLGTMGAGAFAGQTNEAYQETGDFGRAALSGVASAAIEVATEKLLGFVPGVAQAGKKLSGTMAKDLAKTMLEEGFEEVISGVLDPVVQGIAKGEAGFYDEQGRLKYATSEFWFTGEDSVAKQGLMGSASGVILGGVSLYKQDKARTQIKKAVGEKGYALYEALSEMKEIYPSAAKAKDGSKAWQRLGEASVAVAEAAKAVYDDPNLTDSQRSAIARMLTDPQSFFDEIEASSVDEANEKINEYIKKFEALGDEANPTSPNYNPEKVRTQSLFEMISEASGVPSSQIELRFDENAKGNGSYEQELDQQGRLKKAVVTLNPSKIKGKMIGVLAHEYAWHAFEDSMKPENIDRLHKQLTETKWYSERGSFWEKKYREFLKKQKPDISEQELTKAIKSEQIAKYIEETMFRSDSSRNSYKAAMDMFIRGKFANRIAALLGNDVFKRMLTKEGKFSVELAKSIRSAIAGVSSTSAQMKALRRLLNEVVGKQEEQETGKKPELVRASLSSDETIDSEETAKKKIEETESKLSESLKPLNVGKPIIQFGQLVDNKKQTKKGPKKQHYLTATLNYIVDSPLTEEQFNKFTDSISPLTRTPKKYLNNDGIASATFSYFGTQITVRVGTNEALGNVSEQQQATPQEQKPSTVTEAEKRQMELDEWSARYVAWASSVPKGRKNGPKAFVQSLTKDEAKQFFNTVLGKARGGGRHKFYAYTKDGSKRRSFNVAASQLGWQTYFKQKYYDALGGNKALSIMLDGEKYYFTEKAKQAFIDKHSQKPVEQTEVLQEQKPVEAEQKPAEKPKKQWPSKHIEVIGAVKAIEESKSKLIKAIADTRIEGKVLEASKAKQALETILNMIRAETGDEEAVLFKRKTAARRLFEEYNALPDEYKDASIRKFVEFALGTKLTNGTTYLQYLQANTPANMSVSDYVEKRVAEYAKEMRTALDEASKPGTASKAIQFFVAKMDSMLAEANALETSNKLLQSVATARLQIERSSKIDAGNVQTFKSILAGIRFLKGGKVSLSSLRALHDAYSNGKLAAMLADLHGFEGLERGTPEYEQWVKQNIVPEREAVMAIAKSLSESFEGRKRGQALTQEQLDSLSNLIKSLKHLWKAERGEALKKAREKAVPLQQEAKNYAEKKTRVKAFKGQTLGVALDFLGQEATVATVFGGADTAGYKAIWGLVEDSYVAKLRAENRFFGDLNKADEQDLNSKDPANRAAAEFKRKVNEARKAIIGNGNLKKKIFIKTSEGGKVKVSKANLMAFWLNMQSPDNEARLRANKANLFFTSDSGAVYHVSYADMAQAVQDNLTKADTDAAMSLAKLLQEYELNEDGSVKLDEIGNPIPKKGTLTEYAFEAMRQAMGEDISLRDGFYWPIVTSRSQFQNFGQDMNGGWSGDGLVNGRMKGLTNPLNRIELNVNPVDVFDNYVRGMIVSKEVSPSAMEFRRLLTVRSDSDHMSIIDHASFIPDIKIRLEEIYNSMLGRSNAKGDTLPVVGRLVRNFARAKLGLNFKTMVKQLGSLPTALNVKGVKFSFSGALQALFSSEIRAEAQRNPVFAARIRENGYSRAMTLAEGVDSKASQLLMKHIEMMDRATCYLAYGMARQSVIKAYGSLEGAEAKAALDSMFSQIILYTQSNSDAIVTSRIRSGAKGFVAQTLVGMFQADKQQMATACYMAALDAANATTPEAKLMARRKIATFGAGALVTGLFEWLVNNLFKWLYDQEEPEDTMTELETYIDIIKNISVEWVPLFSTIADWLNFGEVDFMATAELSSLVEVISSFKDGVTQKEIRNFALTLAEFLGIPAGNINRLIDGVLGNFAPELAYQYKSLTRGISSQSLSQDVNNAVEKGDERKGIAAISMLYTLYKTPVSNQGASEIYRLKSVGVNVSVRNIPTEYEGEALTEAQISAYRSEYAEFSSDLDSLLRSSSYAMLTDQQKAKAIKTLSNARADVASYKAYGKPLTTRLSRIMSLGIDVSKYASGVALASGVTKREAIAYINTLRGLTRGEKLLVAWLAGFAPNSANRNVLISQLVRFGFKRKDAEALLG